MRALAVVCLILAAALRAETSEWPQQPRLSLYELKSFSEHTTMGGGSLKMFEHDGRKISVVMRCFTSGVRSTDFGVYIATTDGRYRRVLYREPLWGSFLRPLQDGDVIRVFGSDSQDREKLAFTFTISGCFDPQDK